MTPRKSNRSTASNSRKRPRRNASYKSSYLEDTDDASAPTSDDDGRGDSSSSNADARPQRSVRRRAASLENKESQSDVASGPSRQSTSRITRASPRKLRNANVPTARISIRPAAKDAGRQASERISTARKMPTWPPGLPYEILLSVFQYAAYPLWDSALEPNDSIRWLVKTALTCKDFAEPVLSALYYSPPLNPPSRCHGLMTLLRSDLPKYIDYVSKIRYLDVPVASLLTFKYDGHDPIDLARLVAMTPHIRGIGFHLPRDVARFNRLLSIGRVASAYQDSLFDQLDHNRKFLYAWKWNYLVSQGKDSPWLELCTIHTRRVFANVRSLELAHLNMVNTTSSKKSRSIEDESGSALGLLTQLKSLTLNSCYLRAGFLDKWKASSLLRLSIVNGHDMTSQELDNILTAHGVHLQVLELDHNRSLNLAFMGNLATFCPNLATFKMDMTFYRTRVSIATHEPGFDTLLPNGVIPTWPTPLQNIDLIYLRKWGAEPAQVFFESLYNAAESLTSLRRLVVRASVDMAWRDRIKFRDQMIDQLESAFQRRSAPPLQHFSPGAFREQGASHGALPRNDVASSDASTSSKLKTRQFTASRLSAAATRGKGLQGMCDVVDIRIDNLRPMETQYHEDDFLDEDNSRAGN